MKETDLSDMLEKLLKIINIDEELLKMHYAMYHEKKYDFLILSEGHKDISDKRGGIKNSLRADIKRIQGTVHCQTEIAYETLEEGIMKLWKSKGTDVEIIRFRTKKGKGIWTIEAPLSGKITPKIKKAQMGEI